MRTISTLLALASPLLISAQNFFPSPVFGDNGAVRVNIAAGGDAVNAHVLQPDGRLLVAGFGYDIGLNSYHVSLLRIDTICGAPDPSFGIGGSIAQTHQQRTTCTNIAMHPDGRVVGVGMIAPSNAGSQQKAGIFRFMPDGSVDSSFNGLGYHQALWDPTSSGTLWHAFINADSTITCVGESRGNINGGSYAIGAMRFTYDGQLDPAFDNDGLNTLPVSASQGTGAMRPDGRVLAVGETFVNPNIHIVMAQFNTDGSPDTTFGTGGWIVTPVMINGNNDDGGMGASLLPDGRILVSSIAPGSPESFLMARFLADGTVDSTYATDGVSVATMDAANGCSGRDHEVLADGSTLQFGTHLGQGVVLKRDADGQVVSGFGANGFVEANTGSGGEEFRGGFTLPSGRLIGYGSNGEFAIVVRMTTDPGSEGFVDLGADVEVCEGVPVLLDAGSGVSYLWSDASSSQTFNVPASGIYSVTVTSALGCVDSDTVEVTLFPLPPPPVITVAGFDLSTTAVGDLQWYFNGNAIPGATGSSYTATENGDYSVTVTDANGCSTTSETHNVTGVGIAMTPQGTVLRVHPVPAIDRLMIQGLPDRHGLSAVAIDPSGRRIALSWIDRSTLNIDALSTGSYALELGDRERITCVRFIKR